METQTLIYRQYINGGPKIRLSIVSGDHVDRINGGPSYSYNGQTYYGVARILTTRDRAAQWYANAEFDDQGNSDWLT